jgi:hypothetical protein
MLFTEGLAKSLTPNKTLPGNGTGPAVNRKYLSVPVKFSMCFSRNKCSPLKYRKRISLLTVAVNDQSLLGRAGAHGSAFWIVPHTIAISAVNTDKEQVSAVVYSHSQSRKSSPQWTYY